MDRKGVISFVFILVLVSNTCNASSSVFRLRKLIEGEPNNATVTSKVSPTGSPANETKTNPINAGDSQEGKPNGSPIGNETNSNTPPPIDSKNSNKTNNDSNSSGAPSPPAGNKNDSIVDRESWKAVNETTSKLGNNSCKGSLISCRDQEMVACIEASKDGSQKMFIVVQNEGEATLKVTLGLPNYLKNDLPAFEVPKHKTKRMDIPSTVGKSTELLVNSGKSKCVLQLVHPVSVDNIIQQLSFYSKQVTPIYIVYTSFLIALLFGGTWACCKFKKRNEQDGIPYQELEMGLPESASAVNVVDATEGWDHDWDDDDGWGDDNAVKSPNQVTSVSVEDATARSSKKDGWEDGWED